MKRSVRTQRLTKAAAGKILRNPARSMIKIVRSTIYLRIPSGGGQADLDMKPFSTGRFIY
ncbi:Hypothetical protein FKW44_001480 [Caligus rogercresseyi]|uniref:Uncharacterized protein n=1 Tax=Caligus rogercresseyi TaxID=217165 RepID=A0A7T8KIT7_CALRO|nr:Hypothetical protein FKW44_001480 [Caligus rogercresseyi]